MSDTQPTHPSDEPVVPPTPAAAPGAAGGPTVPPAPQPPMPPAPPVAARRTGVWQIIVGIVLMVLSLGSWPRGVLGFIASLVGSAPDSPGTYAGIAIFGFALVAAGIALLVVGLRIRRTNRGA